MPIGVILAESRKRIGIMDLRLVEEDYHIEAYISWDAVYFEDVINKIIELSKEVMDEPIIIDNEINEYIILKLREAKLPCKIITVRKRVNNEIKVNEVYDQWEALEYINHLYKTGKITFSHWFDKSDEVRFGDMIKKSIPAENMQEYKELDPFIRVLMFICISSIK